MAEQRNAVVGIVMGSASDSELMKQTKKTLEEFGIGCEFRVLSAHRTPEEACAWASGAKDRGLKVIIAAAGLAAHLAGALSLEEAATKARAKVLRKAKENKVKADRRRKGGSR